MRRLALIVALGLMSATPAVAQFYHGHPTDPLAAQRGYEQDMLRQQQQQQIRDLQEQQQRLQAEQQRQRDQDLYYKK